MSSSTKTRAGSRRHIIAIKRHNGNTRAGEPTYDVDDDWTVVTSMSEVPAEVLGVGGGQIVRGMQMDNDTMYLVTLPSTERTRGILPTDRIVYRGTNLHINRINDRAGNDRDLAIQCKD